MLELNPTCEKCYMPMLLRSTEPMIGAFECAFCRERSEELSLLSDTSMPAFIYVVDDNQDLTELYTTLLQTAGFSVRPFNERAEALASLQAESVKPDLLITDYQGGPIPVERFIGHCLAINPALRILIASGFHESETRFSSIRPNHFLRKPFTAEEFLREVRTVLTCEDATQRCS